MKLGWIISLTLIAVVIFSGVEIDGNGLLIAGGLFAIAGAISMFFTGIKEILKK